MPDFAAPLQRLIEEFRRLPGIGQKSESDAWISGVHEIQQSGNQNLQGTELCESLHPIFAELIGQ